MKDRHVKDKHEKKKRTLPGSLRYYRQTLCTTLSTADSSPCLLFVGGVVVVVVVVVVVASVVFCFLPTPNGDKRKIGYEIIYVALT